MNKFATILKDTITTKAYASRTFEKDPLQSFMFRVQISGLPTGVGFQKVAGEAITNNTYTLPVTFIPTGIHGNVTGRAILKVKAHTGETTGEPTDNDWKYITLTAEEDYTPDFTAKNSYNFDIVSLGSSRPSNSNLYPQTNNYAAEAAEGNIMGTKWECTIVADENADEDYSQCIFV